MEAAADRTPLMLIHGAWLSSRSWENFARYFRDRGFAVSAPEWPRKVGDVEQLREELAARGIEPSPVRLDEHGGKQYRVFFAKEPYGVCFCFGQPA